MKVLATLEEYNAIVAESGDKLVVIDFYADWCGPCKMIAPKLAEMEKEFTDVIFCKVNVDDNEDAATKCEIKAMPTFHFMKGGVKVAELEGANEQRIREKVNQFK